MSLSQFEQKVQDALATAGITIGGQQPWDIQVNNSELFKRLQANPSLGLGEGYMDQLWECERLDEFFYRILAKLEMTDVFGLGMILRVALRNILVNQQTRLRSKQVAKVHYNLGNELYQLMLGDTMAYTCAYWKDAQDLDAAQNAKYELICRKIDIQKGDKVLELGCGWGGFAYYVATKYGCEVDAVNISTEQMKYAQQICKSLPVNIHVCDYRDIGSYNPKLKKFDKVVSIGMCEHVGYKNYPYFIDAARSQLKDDGLFLLHTIGKNYTTYFGDPWIQKYIFPNGMLPTIKLLSKAIEKHFVVEDLHNFGAYYDKTLMAWDDNFVANWSQIKSNYDERFYRMWRYYLLSCAGAFRARDLQLWQFVLSPHGVRGGYQSIR